MTAKEKKMENYEELDVLKEASLMGFSCIPTTTIYIPLLVFLIYGFCAVAFKRIKTFV